MIPTAMIFIDGENLLWRFEAMKDGGRVPRIEVSHSPGRFVWSSRVTRMQSLEIFRAGYYTSHVGSDEVLRALENEIRNLQWTVARNNTGGKMVPHVFKKPAREQKAASVDINISIDLLRHSYQRNVDVVVLISGDGDYIQLVREAMRTGTRVVVAALSSGVNGGLMTSCDSFWDLDLSFFEREEYVLFGNPKATHGSSLGSNQVH